MLSPNQKEFRYFNLSKSKYSAKSPTNASNLSPKEGMPKNNHTEFVQHYDFDKESIASTYDSSQRTGLKNIRSDTNIFRHQKNPDHSAHTYNLDK
jgi:hypothetical protein